MQPGVRRRRWVACGATAALVFPLMMAWAALPASAATYFGAPPFEQQWRAGEATTPNFWGPLATARQPLLEPYEEGSSGPACPPNALCAQGIFPHQRLVQYFDKARMERTTPAGSVTNGLLTVEMLSGRVQVGDTKFEQRAPARVPVAGDPDNVFPTYADLATQQAAVPNSGAGDPAATLLLPNGATAQYDAARPDPQAAFAAYDSVTGHRVPRAFVQFREKAGTAAVGLAVTEPFWAQVKVAGAAQTVLIQAFERRVLTYTPTNPDPYKVEFGNIGQHYYQWRYGGSSGTMLTPTAAPATTPTIATPGSLGLPVAPAGFSVRAISDFAGEDGPPIRALFHPKTGVLHVMTTTGNLFQIDRTTGARRRIVALYSTDPTTQVFYGADFAPDGTLYVARVLQPKSDSGQSVTHSAEILRVSDTKGDGTVDTVAVVNRLRYPGGNLRFNHEVTALKIGPDGLLYVGVGSHTDHGETDGDKGEVPETSAIFRIRPDVLNSPFELFADGVRNPFASAFRADGKLFVADHGPQSDLPEELNYIERGKHYGFPYRFGNNVKNPEPDAPPEPGGIEFVPPIPNVGPDALNTDGADGANPSYTFTPHSAPGGLVFYNATKGANLFPAKYRGDGFLAMYGNVERSGEVRGFSMLQLTLTERSPGIFEVSTHTFLSGLRRPTDVAVAPDGALVVLESSAAATPTDQTLGFGRVLEVVPSGA